MFCSLLGVCDLFSQSTKPINDTVSTVIDTNAATTKKFNLPQVEVYEQRASSNSSIEFSPNSQISGAELQIISPLQISEALKFSPGMNIRDYGGLGSIKTLSIRGAGSMRTLVLLDGIPINSSQNGSFDLNNITVGIVNNIEIIRGGASAIFGGNAIGGAVNIRTNCSPQKTILANLSYGSFNEITANITGNLVSKYDINSDLSLDFLTANASYQNSKGDFSFKFNQFGKDSVFKRENADYSNLAFSISGKMSISNWSLWARGIFSTTDKGVPGAILQGKINHSQDRFKEDNYTFLVNSDCVITENSGLFISGVLKKNNTIFTEPSKTAEPNSKYFLDDYSLSARYNYVLFDIFNEMTSSISYSSLTGNMLDPDVDSIVNRTSFSFGYRVEKNTLFTENQQFKFNVGGRIDKNSNNPIALSANIGGIYDIIWFPIKLRTNFSRNFRFPNFNEMYYRNYGTKNLLAEKSNNFNLGVFGEYFNLFSINVDGFYIDTKDMITAVPTSPVSWSAKNIDRAVSTGLEVSVALINKSKYISNLNLSYSIQQTVDKSVSSLTYNKILPYTPNELLNLLLAVNFYKTDFGIKFEYSSFRYIQADNNPKDFLPKYFVTDLFINKKINIDSISFIVRLECKNIFDMRYELISNYIMPGRQFRATIGIEY